MERENLIKKPKDFRDDQGLWGITKTQGRGTQEGDMRADG